MSRLWVVAYDIADNRRRARVARALLDHLARVQESVFEGWLTPAVQRQLQLSLAELIEPAEDSIRFYPLLLREPSCRQTDGAMAPLRQDGGYWIV
jgi:CRISPR-associated protein Cas2